MFLHQKCIFRKKKFPKSLSVQKLLVPLQPQISKVVFAQMAESVDALVSNTSGATHPGSIPGLGTKSRKFFNLRLFFLFFVFSFWKSYRNLILLQSFIPSAGTTVGDWLLWLMTTDWRRTSLFTYSLNSPKVTSPLVSCNFFKR